MESRGNEFRVQPHMPALPVAFSTRPAAAQSCLIPQLSYRSQTFWTQFNTIYVRHWQENLQPCLLIQVLGRVKRYIL